MKTPVILKNRFVWFIKFLKAIKRHWEKVTLSICLIAYAFVSDTLGILGALTEADNQAQLIGAVGANTEIVTDKITETEQVLKDEIKNNSKISCRNLGGGDWVIDDSMITDNQYLILRDGQKTGSIRMYGDFEDTFIMKFVFVPSMIEGINAAFSIKDESSNELMLSLGDDVSNQDDDMNFDFYKASFKNNQGEIFEITGPGNTEINPAVRSDSEVFLQLQTVQQANDLSASAFMLYAPSKKPHQKVPLNLFKTDIPHFFERSVKLNLGMRHADGGDNPKLKLVDCEIQETGT